MLILFTIIWYIKFEFRRMIYKLFGYKRPSIKYKKFINGLSETNNIIYNKINEGKPFLVSRLGSGETEICFQSELLKAKLILDYTKKAYLDGKIMSGIFPKKKSSFIHFSNEYINAISEIDLIGVWQDEREKYLILLSKANPLITSLENLEPFFSSSPWTKALESKKVLVIHPFVDTISKQLKKQSYVLFPHLIKGLMPATSYILYKPVTSYGDNDFTDFKDWFEALNKMKSEIKNIDFDIAIIAAGAYGLPLGAFIKNMGKIAIHLAGASQLLFGVIGSRWTTNERYKNLINSNWIYPLESDFDDSIKKSFQKREGGGYW